ncbi:DUF4870 domain-containing protein [Salinimicrobium sp. GXAS 041]|uniref:DUF4870 domain-containing protein n=1 Tax=Salinimicrobium sp. GXAS 041 TaxID=3400806 RepID=UPI003C716E38
MESHNNKSYQTLAALIHISTFSKYIIPLGNFIFPLIIWTTGKKDRLIDHHGKQALNFQLSIFFYMVLVVGCALAGILITGINSGIGEYSIPNDLIRLTTVSAALPLLTVITVASVLLAGLFILELACVIIATVKASDAKYYKYPITINFITTSEEVNKRNKKMATEPV